MLDDDDDMPNDTLTDHIRHITVDEIRSGMVPPPPMTPPPATPRSEPPSPLLSPIREVSSPIISFRRPGSASSLEDPVSAVMESEVSQGMNLSRVIEADGSCLWDCR